MPAALGRAQLCYSQIKIKIVNWHQSISTQKTLSDTEKNYPNINRELLGVVHTVGKFNLTTGHKTIIHTDHRPLPLCFRKAS